MQRKDIREETIQRQIFKGYFLFAGISLLLLTLPPDKAVGFSVQRA